MQGRTVKPLELHAQTLPTALTSVPEPQVPTPQFLPPQFKLLMVLPEAIARHRDVAEEPVQVAPLEFKEPEMEMLVNVVDDN